MRSNKKYLSLLLIFVLAFSLVLPMASAEAAQARSIKILFTHDMHSSFVPATIADEKGSLTEAGGFARLYTAIEEERAANRTSTLLVDAGDYSMGTLFQTLETTQAPELRLMGKMGYDAVTAGNHEFDYTIGGFAKSLKAAKQSGDTLPAFVMSNITLPETDTTALDLKTAMQDYGVKEYIVLDKNGIKVGLYGLMGEVAEANAPKSKPATFENNIETSKRIVKVLKEQEKADLIICLSHSGTNPDVSQSEDEQLAKAVPDIDVIISGHTHTTLREPIIVGHTVIISCGADSAFLGVLDLTYDQIWKVQNYNLKKIDSSLEGDASITAQIDKYKALVNQYLKPYAYQYDQVIANSPYQFENTDTMFDNPGDYALGDFAADAFVYAVKQAEGENYEPIDVAVVPMGTIRASINRGNVTVADAFKILSLGTGPDGLSGYPLISVNLKGFELKNICEVDASISSIMGDAQLFLSGVKYTYNPNRLIFNKVTDAVLIKDDGSIEKIEPEKTYRVACGLYSGQMLAYVKSKSMGIISLTPKDKDGNQITDFNKQIIYANSNYQKQEIKEWQAVTQYLMSFDKQNGISTIPAAYSVSQGRKIKENSTNPFDLVSNLNTFALIVIGVVLLILALILLIVFRIVKGIKKRHKKRKAEIM